MIIFILQNSLALLSTYLVFKKYFNLSGIIDSMLAFFILFYAQIIFILTLLGSLSLLTLNNIILFEFVLLLSAILTTKTNSFLRLKGVKKNKLNVFSFIHKLSKTEIFCLSIILGFAIVKIIINLVNPPFGWDDLNYHFTFPVEWLKQGNLETPPVVFCDPSPTYYPINGSLFFLWFMLPLKSVFIADLGQLPFFVIAFLAVYSLGRKLSLSQEYALYAASIFTLVPNYFKQLEIAYIDVMVAALLLSALNFLFRLYRDGSLKDAVLYSLCLGLMLGVKTTALPYALLLFIPFLYFCLSRFKLNKMPLLFLVSSLLIVLTGGFSYIRNFVQTGNPLYPLNFTLFNTVILRGVIDGCVYRAHFLADDYNLGKILFSEGLGGQTIVFFLPAVFLGLPLAIIKNRKGLNFNLAYFMILPFLLILAYRFVIPLANLRYLYALLGITSVIAFYAVDSLRLPKKILKILIVLCVLGSIAELANHGELVISLAVSLLLFFILPFILKGITYRRSTRYVAFVVLIGFISLLFLQKDYMRNEYPRYLKMVKYSGFWPEAAEAWVWLNQNTTGDNIAYAGRPVPFPLYGSGFKNRVYYVSVNKAEPSKLHYYPGSRYVWGYDGESVHRTFAEEMNYRGRPAYDTWLGNLLKRKTGYLFIYSLHQIKAIEFPLEDEWANSHPDIFDLVFTNSIVHIYRIRR